MDHNNKVAHNSYADEYNSWNAVGPSAHDQEHEASNEDADGYCTEDRGGVNREPVFVCWRGIFIVSCVGVEKKSPKILIPSR